MTLKSILAAKLETVRLKAKTEHMLFRGIVYYGVIVFTFFILFLNPNPWELSLSTLLEKNLSLLTHPNRVLSDLFTPNSGLTEEAIGWRIIWMKSQMDQFNLEDYNLSENMLAESRIVQRIGDVAWPIALNTNSRYLFITEEESQKFLKCAELSRKAGVILEQCP